MNVTEGILLWLLGQPAVITVIVNALKTWPFAKKYPKLVATILNVIATAGADFLFDLIPGQGLDAAIATLLTGVAQGWGSSGFYEVVVKPGVKIVMPPK